MRHAVVIHRTIAAIMGLVMSAPVQPQEAERVDEKSTGAQHKAQPPRSAASDVDANRHTAKPRREAEPDHYRGQIATYQEAALALKTRDGRTLPISVPEGTPIIGLTKASFASIDFGTYVGAVGVKLEEYSPIVRDSAVWLHKGFELRIIDEDLRGISLGHKNWDLVPNCIISHGWVDDIEVRVLSIKWGPTDYDETDMEIPRDAPVHRMSVGDKSWLVAGAHALVGARKAGGGKYVAAFVIVGKDGIVPAL